MTADHSAAASTRHSILTRHFPHGVPALWCPPLTHYTADGQLDRARITAHLRFLTRWVKGILVPGTTGDGWELSPDEIRQLLETVLEAIRGQECQLLLGALHPEAGQARAIINSALAWLQSRRPAATLAESLTQNQVCGFAICPPRGASISQEEMRPALVSLLELPVPLALYQLPQVTENEMSPALLAELASRFPNFVLLKDTSGRDRAVLSGLDFQGVYLVRGMEGNYARWLKVGGGGYDGFLLSTANSFAGTLEEIRRLLADGRVPEAKDLSDRLSRLVDELFQIAEAARGGNKFANANKLADHFFAHGPGAAALPPPRLHSGAGLTPDMVGAAGTALDRHGFMPTRGYLESEIRPCRCTA